LSNPHNTDGCEEATWTPTTSPQPRWARNSRCQCSLERRWSSRTFRYGYLVTT